MITINIIFKRIKKVNASTIHSLILHLRKRKKTGGKSTPYV